FIVLTVDLGNNEIFYLSIVLLSQVLVVKSSEFHFDSPLLWYTSAVFIYHFSTVISSAYGFYTYENKFQSILIYGLIYYTAVTPLFFINYQKDYSLVWKRIDEALDKRVLTFFFFLFGSLVLLTNAYFFTSGVSGKGDAILKGVTKFNFIYNWFSVVAIVTLVSFRNSKYFKFIVVISTLLCLFTSLNTGERNVLLSFILTLIIISLTLGKLNKKNAVGCILLIILLIPILQELKAVFVKDNIDIYSNFEGTPFIIKLLQGEFTSASRNLDWIISRNDDYDYFYGVNIIKDLIIGLSPISTGFQNTQSWFNTTFFPQVVATGQGYGFSLYGSFYVSMGYFGLVSMSLIHSILIVIIFNNRAKSYILFMVSIFMITPAIYSQRGDISVLLSFVIKQNLIPLMLIYFPSMVMRGKVIVR
ncbi:O-antigen polysaccharide polymerase Wzy, partial [Vibrio kanaloae]